MPSSRASSACRAVCSQDAVAGVDEQDGDVSGGGAGHHVAGVLVCPGVSAMMNLRRGVAK